MKKIKIFIVSLFFVSLFFIPNQIKAESCGASTPFGTPDLFQIDVQATSATLHFTPVSGSDYYFIAYGHMSGDKQYGANIGSGGDGVQSFTIEALAPNTTYVFTVRGGNGCAPGEWGNEYAITTAAANGNITNYYRYSAPGVEMSAPMTPANANMSVNPAVQPKATETPKPTGKAEPSPKTVEGNPTPTPDKNCILGFCW